MKKSIGFAILLLLGIASFSYWYLTDSQPLEVELLSPQRGPISAYITVSGSVEGERTVDVISRIPGHLVEILAEEGERVAKDRVLAKLDDVEARANLKGARAKLKRSKEKVREIERKLSRLEGVKLSGGEALQTIEDVEGTLRDAREAVSIGEAELELAQFNLSLHNIKAPFPGVVIHRNAEVGQAVQPALGKATTLFTVVDDDPLFIESRVDAGDVGVVNFGSLVEVSSDAWPEHVWQEKISYIGLAVNQEELAGVNTFQIKSTLSKEAPPLLIGQQVDLKIRIAHSEDAIKIPYTAILQGAEGPRVAMLENDQVRFQPIETGIQSLSFTEVVSGVSVGDRLILPDGRDLSANTRVVSRQ